MIDGAEKERDIFLAGRRTKMFQELLTDLNDYLTQGPFS